MLKVSVLNVLVYLNVIVSLALLGYGNLTPFGAAVYALITSVLVLASAVRSEKRRITYSTALLLYTVATQFGLVLVYYFFGRDSVAYPDSTISFLQSPLMPKAMIMGAVAITAFRAGTLIARKRNRVENIAILTVGRADHSARRMYVAGFALLVVVLAYFLFNILVGNMSLTSTYRLFRQSGVYGSAAFSYILILYYVGTAYLASAGPIMKHRLGWLIWLAIAGILALNGNKGEFMYSLLAVVGMKGIQGQKISGRLLALLAVMLFLIIPVITSLRSIGIAGNLASAQLSPFDAFTEMGMQIRMNVFVMQDLENGRYGMLYGASYYQPVLNLLTPFLTHTQATAGVRQIYGGYGFSQVAEGYLNFGAAGILLYFGIVGYLIGRWEVRVRSSATLAYLGTIVCILINVTRNYFAFVPGQILIVTVIFYFVDRFRVGKRSPGGVTAARRPSVRNMPLR